MLCEPRRVGKVCDLKCLEESWIWIYKLGLGRKGTFGPGGEGEGGYKATTKYILFRNEHDIFRTELT